MLPVYFILVQVLSSVPAYSWRAIKRRGDAFSVTFTATEKLSFSTRGIRGHMMMIFALSSSLFCISLANTCNALLPFKFDLLSGQCIAVCMVSSLQYSSVPTFWLLHAAPLGCFQIKDHSAFSQAPISHLC